MSISKEQWDGYSARDKIYIVCKKMHLLKPAQFVNRKILGNAPAPMPEEIQTPQVAVIPEHKKENPKEKKTVKTGAKENWKHLDGCFEEAISEFARIIPSRRKKIVFSGHILEFDKGTCQYLNQLAEADENVELLLLSHAIHVRNDKADRKINFNYYTVPYTAGINRYEKEKKIDLPDEVKETIEGKGYLKALTQRLESRHKDMGKNYPQALGYELYRYYQAFLDHFQPEMVILWCEFYAGHSILKEICQERGIPVLYMEFGALPGTFAIEENGQMGESLVTLNAEEFVKQPVSDEEREQAKNVLAFLKESGLNRRVQQKTDVMEEIAKKYKPNRPVVVMFGQNDYEAGIKLYTEESARYHSPIFEGSDAAAKYVGDLARKNDWNFIYKPHQMMVRVGECLETEFPTDTIWVGDTDINELIDLADVCITIVSQCGYVSLIREKPTVMLGYTQLQGKGCAYEAFRPEDVEVQIKLALEQGYTQEQKRNFQTHVAQMLKYYLFDDLQQEEGFGQPLEAGIRYVLNRLPEEEKEKNYKQQNLLFVCGDEFQLCGAIAIKKNLNLEISADLIWRGEKDDIGESREVQENFGQVCFLPKGKEEFLKELTKLEFDKNYDALYLCNYDQALIALFNRLRADHKEICVHLFDGAELEFYLKDVGHDIERSHRNKETKAFFEGIVELSMYLRPMKMWKERLNFPITVLPKRQAKSTSEQKEDGKPCFIFTESMLFAKRYASNESQLVDVVGELVGEGKLEVLLSLENSVDLYGPRGYETVRISGREFRKFRTEMAGKLYVFAPYINEYFFEAQADKEAVYFDLSGLLTTNYPLLTSNSFRKFKSALEEMALPGYYCPGTIEELRECLIYEGGKR